MTELVRVRLLISGFWLILETSDGSAIGRAYSGRDQFAASRRVPDACSPYNDGPQFSRDAERIAPEAVDMSHDPQPAGDSAAPTPATSPFAPPELRKLGLINLGPIYANCSSAELAERAVMRGEGTFTDRGALVGYTGKHT